MPPKRKRAGDEATATTETTTTSRATRSSARGKAAKDTSESGENGSMLMNTDVVAPPAKKSRANTKGSTKTGTKRGKAASKAGDDDESGPHKPSLAEVNSVPQTTSKTSSSTKRQSKTQVPAVTEPYNPARGEELFKEYADSDDSTLIGPEGLERLCNDANIALDGALPLILAWQFGCTEMAKITQQEWSSGTSVLKVSSLPTLSLVVHELEDLLLYDKPPPAKKSPEPYNRTDFWKYCENKKEALKKFYFFCFTLAKPEGSRNIDIETASAMWSVLLVPKYPIMSDILAFIGEKQGTYKAANKDLWSMMLEFCETVNPNLTDYESDGAWPTLLDDFVSWKKESAGEPMQTD